MRMMRFATALYVTEGLTATHRAIYIKVSVNLWLWSQTSAMTTLVASGRLQNVIEYFVNVRKPGPLDKIKLE